MEKICLIPGLFVHFAELAEGVRAGTKAAAIACVASAIPTVRELVFLVIDYCLLTSKFTPVKYEVFTVACNMIYPMMNRGRIPLGIIWGQSN